MHPEVSTVVRAAWYSVLGLPDGAAAANFFAAGGTSATAIVLMERVEYELDIEFPLETLFLESDLDAVLRECDARYTTRIAEGEA